MSQKPPQWGWSKNQGNGPRAVAGTNAAITAYRSSPASCVQPAVNVPGPVVICSMNASALNVPLAPWLTIENPPVGLLTASGWSTPNPATITAATPGETASDVPTVRLVPLPLLTRLFVRTAGLGPRPEYSMRTNS